MTHHDDWQALDHLMNENHAVPPPMRRLVLTIEISIGWAALLAAIALITLVWVVL